MNLLKKMAGMVFRASDPRLSEYLGVSGFSESGESINAISAMQVSTVWACVRRISGAISSLPVSVVRTSADGVPEEVPGHYLNRILQHSPNADQTALDFFDFMAGAIELHGDGIARKLRGSSGQIIGLEPLIPSTVARTRLPNGKIKYAWTSEGRTFSETEENVLHIRGPGGSALGGLSAISYGRDAIGISRSAERTQSRLFRQGMKSTVAIIFDKWLADDQRNKARTRMSDDFAGVENSGKPIVLEGGTKIEKLNISPVDAEILLTRGFAVEEICRFFDMPPVMIGHTSKTTSWPAGVEQQFLIFLQLCLRTRVKRIEMAMEKQLLTPAEFARGLRIRFNFEALLRADSAGRAAFYQIMTQIGGLTINEMRALEGRKPVPGGDIVLVQMQNIPLSEAGKQKKPDDTTPKKDGEDDPQN